MNLPVTTRAFSKGGEGMEILLDLLVSVEAGLLVELIRKWLDGDK